MKKIFLLILMLSLFQVVNAQNETKPNAYIVGGSINFLIQNNYYPISSLGINAGIGTVFSNSTNDIKNTTFAITPYFGKELNNRFLVGFNINYRMSNNLIEDATIFNEPGVVDIKRNSNSLGVGLFNRYIINPENVINFYLRPYISYTFSNDKEFHNSSLIEETRTQFIGLGIGAGMLYEINDKFSAIMRFGQLNYTNGKWHVVDSEKEKSFNSLGANFNLSTVYFGFEFKF